MARIEVGEIAPQFELPGTGGVSYRLAEMRGETLVLAFYPGDFTPTCTKQFCSYRDRGDEFGDLGVTVWGISAQDVDSHDRFAAKHDLEMPLLADAGKEVSRSYGVLGPLGNVRRSIFIIDGEGILRWRHVAPIAGVSYKSVDDIAEALAAL